MADYFLLNYYVIKIGKEKYHGVLTKTGRGSGGGFYLNNLLGFTSMDRFAEEIPLLSERFISTSRILQSKTLPDIDYRILLHFLGKILGRSLRMINLVNY